MQCPHCSASVDDGWRFCGVCGKGLPSTSPASASSSAVVSKKRTLDDFFGGKHREAEPASKTLRPASPSAASIPGKGRSGAPSPNYAEKFGDLFTASESLLHCISADVVMGKGVALTFKTKFGGVDEIKRQKPAIGGVCTLHRGGRYIYYLITKAKYHQIPTYTDLQSSLEAAREHCESHGVKAIAMPQIGCGLDRLKWEQVKGIIKAVFPPACGINVTVYIYKKGP